MALEAIRQTQDEQMDKKIHRVRQKSLKCDRNIEELEILEQEIHQLIAAQEDKIDKQVELVKAKVDDLARYLKERIRESEHGRLHEVQLEKMRQKTLGQDIRHSGSTATTARNSMCESPTKVYTQMINRFDDELNRVLAIDNDTICLNPVQGTV